MPEISKSSDPDHIGVYDIKYKNGAHGVLHPTGSVPAITEGLALNDMRKLEEIAEKMSITYDVLITTLDEGVTINYEE